MITICGQATPRTLMPALAEGFRRVRSAGACLTRATRVNLHELSASVFSFVGNQVEKGSPSGIPDRLRQHSTGKSLDVQIFDGNQAVIINQPTTNLVVKVCALVANVKVRALQKLNGFTSVIATFLSSGNLALCASQFRLGFSVPVWIVNLYSVAQSGECGQTNINADLFNRRGQRFWRAFNRKANVPASGFALDRDSLDSSLNGTMQLDLDESDALQAQFEVSQLAPVAIRRVCDAVETRMRLEARESGFLFCFDATKESLERLVNAAQHILTAGGTGEFCVSCRANLRQLFRLGVVVDALAVDAPRIPALLQRGVVEPTRFAELGSQQCVLRLRRIQAGLKGFAYNLFSHAVRAFSCRSWLGSFSVQPLCGPFAFYHSCGRDNR